MADSPYIFEANLQTFQKLVIEQSQETTVLVDFWADWCQPCKTLMPILSKLADDYQGAFVLVKVNSDENKELSTQFGVRSLPTVKVFKNGEMVDEFMGVLPEPQIREFIDKHRTRASEGLRQQALQLYSSGEVDQAENLLKQVLETDPDYHEAALELAVILLAQDKVDEAEAVVADIPEDKVEATQLAALQVQIQKKKLQQEAGDVTELEKQAADNPDDLQIMLDLAKTYIANEDAESGLALYLKVMQKDRSFGDDAGRKGLLDTFTFLEPDNPLVKQYRGKMFSLLH